VKTCIGSWLAVLLAVSGLPGCPSSHAVTGIDNQTKSGAQSETAATTSYASKINRIVVAYNDETNESPTHITYTPTDRVIRAGTSLMGWSYSDDVGAHWTYGGKVPPPKGWACLWGDPALTTSGAAYNVVFLSNLAMPSAKFPSGGIHGYVYYGNGKSAYIGDACIARSTDGGKSFTSYQCLSNTQPVPDVPDATQGHFYDGGSLASNAAGEIFAAYVDVATGLIDVYRSPGASGQFTLLPTPFPNMVAVSHGRLRTGPDGALYAAAQIVTGGGYYIYMNRYLNGAWGTPALASDASEVYPGMALGPTVQGAPLTLRTGPQFGYDIGAASEGGKDAVRMLYTRRDDKGHLYLDASACTADLSQCMRVPGWRFQGGGPGNTPVDTYNPDVVAWRGFFGLPPTWQATWAYHYGAQASINVNRATLGYVNGNAFLFPVDILRNAPVCSDTRGYWGDYDAMIMTGFQGASSQWMRFNTDSSAGCTRRWVYTSVAQHVQQASYAY
jgi:hypothetical protein